jgi:hypothetical protein
MKRRAETIYQKINSLTTNEDHQQDLWVFYLENNPISAFEDFLERLRIGEMRYQQDKQLIQGLFTESGQLKDFLCNFTEFEQDIMCLMAIGFTAIKIARYKRISEVRILQAIDAIKSRSIWKTLRKEVYGS